LTTNASAAWWVPEPPVDPSSLDSYPDPVFEGEAAEDVGRVGSPAYDVVLVSLFRSEERWVAVGQGALEERVCLRVVTCKCAHVCVV
jgi:hypothetical protein